MRTITDGAWQSRLLACIAALVWQGLIISALMSSARPGAPLVWEADAHSAISLPRQSAIQYVSIVPSLSAMAEPRRPFSSPPIVSESTVGALRIAISEVEAALAAGPDLNVAVPPMAAVTGNLPIRCEAHIHQDSRGQVQAIDFGACTGDQVWQRRLLERLQQAADLVRPKPGASVAPVKTIVFDSDSIAPEILATQLMEPAPISAERHDSASQVAP